MNNTLTREKVWKWAKESGVSRDYWDGHRFDPSQLARFAALIAAELQQGEPVAIYKGDLANNCGAIEYTVHQGCPIKIGDKLYPRPPLIAAQSEVLAKAKEALNVCHWALTQPINDWKGECERKALDTLREALAAIDVAQKGEGG